MTNDFVNLGFNGARLRHGVIAGIAGGLVFGLMMQMMGMMPMIAAMVGSTSAAVGWVVHLFISAAFGLGLAVLARPSGFGGGALVGALWGVVLWAVAAMLVMRVMMGMPIAFDEPARMSLVGHVVYGLVAGLTLTALVRRAPATEAASERAAA